MERIFLGGAVVLGLLGGAFIERFIEPVPVVYAKAPEEPKEAQAFVVIDWTPERIDKEIVNQAKEYGVSASVMRKVIDCESAGSTTVQSFIINVHGVREESYGLAQINLPAHPDVNIEEAIDPAFAINFVAREMAAGNAWKWTCWRNMQ